MQNQNLIDRYVYAVTKRLPESQRDEIEKEIRGLILDMAGKEDPSEDEIADILVKLGEPTALADKYRERKRYLIGPEIFDSFILVLKIVLCSVLTAVSIGLVLKNIMNPEEDLIRVIAEFISTLFSAAISGFATTTIIFGMIEANGGKGIKKWDPKKLPLVPSENKKGFKTSSTIISIALTGIFFRLLLFGTDFFAVYLQTGSDMKIVPLFNKQALLGNLSLFIILYIALIIRESLKLIEKGWTMKMCIISLLLDITSVVILILIFTNPSLWNQNFTSDLNSLNIFSTNTDIEFIFKLVKSLITIGVLIGPAINIIKAIVYGIKNIVKNQ